MTLYFITGNRNKFQEAKQVIPALELLEIDLPEIQSLDGKEIIEAKLREAMRHHDGEFIVEDLGISLECLGRLPGPLIKWFLKELGPQGIYELTAKYGNSKARIRYLLGYAKSGSVEFFEIIVDGDIVEPRGSHAFGFDPIFQPEGSERTYGEMTIEEKNAVSHRGQGLRRLREFLSQ